MFDNPPKFNYITTACWRGYFGRWKIKDSKLYLTGLEANISIDGKDDEVGLDYFFPNQKQVFASWFTGKIRVPIGEMIEYIHMGYHSKYQKDLFLMIEDGVVINIFEIENS